MGIPNYLMALANHEGPATINAGGLSIPVKIMDISHEYDPRRCIDACEFKCLVVNQDQIKPSSPNLDEFVHRHAKEILNRQYGAKALREAMKKCVNPFEIRKVIFNNPATIVYWADGEKTVVKCQEGDVYSKETGLALCFAKKALGNKGGFNDVFHKWIPEEKKPKNVEPADTDTVESAIDEIRRMAEAAYSAPREVEVDEDE